MTDLVTVPSFLFHNGEEQPIQVSYYNGSIELSQYHYGNHLSNTILIDPGQVKELLKEILKHKPKAEKYLSK